MEIRNILVSLDPRDPATAVLGSAVELAERFGARVSAAAAAQPLVETFGAELGTAAALQSYQRQRGEIDEGLGLLQEKFQSTVPGNMRGTFHSLVQQPTGFLVDESIAADLVLLPTRISPERSNAVDAGEVIVSAGRPVLLVPEGTRSINTSNVVIAWTDRREARRAVADALPFLKTAKDVYVVSVEQGDYPDEHESFKAILAWLDRHGIKATGDIVPPQDTVGRTIEAAAGERKAEFIVAGGYGHTRFREWLFGGVTRDLVESLSRCRFISN
jgi:nucleotide-binding universal stress UspA family protein